MTPILRNPNSTIACSITFLLFLLAVSSAVPSPSSSKNCDEVVKDSNQLLLDLIGPIPGKSNHYAQFMPINKKMMKLSRLEEGTALSEPVDCSVSASERSSRDIPLCPSHSTININNLRIPSRLVETTCTCTSPNHSKYSFLSSHIRIPTSCVPVEYLVKVIIFDENCEQREIKYERIALGCKAIYQNAVASTRDIEDAPVESVEVPT